MNCIEIKTDEDGSGEIEWAEFRELFTSTKNTQQNHEF
jgi:hypothetical protein